MALLNDYGNIRIPAAQRLFLMDEVRLKTPDAVFPTLEAERLAARFVEAGESNGGTGLRATPLPGVWRLTSKSGRAIALYRTEAVAEVLRGITGRAKGAEISAVQPGARAGDDAIAAGPMLPGWQLAISNADSTVMEQTARSRMASYLWSGYIAIGAMAIMGLLVGQSYRRQMRLARLKTDLVGAVSHELKTPLASMRLLVDSLLDEDQPDPARTRDYLRLIAIAVWRRCGQRLSLTSSGRRTSRRFGISAIASNPARSSMMIAKPRSWPWSNASAEERV
jgi:signal transduction histidine kinase